MVNHWLIMAGWWFQPTPLKNMRSSVGMIFHSQLNGKIIQMIETTNQNISWLNPALGCGFTPQPKVKIQPRFHPQNDVTFTSFTIFKSSSGLNPWNPSYSPSSSQSHCNPYMFVYKSISSWFIRSIKTQWKSSPPGIGGFLKCFFFFFSQARWMVYF